MLKPLRVDHVRLPHRERKLFFHELPTIVTPEQAMVLGRAIQQAGIESLQGARGEHVYLFEGLLDSTFGRVVQRQR
jgi:hypothetical protein